MKKKAYPLLKPIFFIRVLGFLIIIIGSLGFGETAIFCDDLNTSLDAAQSIIGDEAQNSASNPHQFFFKSFLRRLTIGLTFSALGYLGVRSKKFFYSSREVSEQKNESEATSEIDLTPSDLSGSAIFLNFPYISSFEVPKVVPFSTILGRGEDFFTCTSDFIKLFRSSSFLIYQELNEASSFILDTPERYQNFTFFAKYSTSSESMGTPFHIGSDCVERSVRQTVYFLARAFA